MKPEDSVKSKVNGAHAGNCVCAFTLISGKVSTLEVRVKSLVDEDKETALCSCLAEDRDDRRFVTLSALGPIRPEYIVIESPGSKVEALFKIMVKCEESRQKHRVDDDPRKDSSKLQSNTMFSRLAKFVYESKVISTSLSSLNEALIGSGSTSLEYVMY